ncbi:carboxylesterase [Xylaria acuta]|nr:carboxylesterase [Xylaria acuta]
MLRIIWGLPVVIGLSLAQTVSTPVVDLGYAKYGGFYNSEYDQNVFKGIRYAAAPVGELRWQMPQPPARNRSEVLPAVDFAPQCPQASNAGSSQPIGVPSGDEDCLFLNVVAPANGKRLPVLVWIHGGGYGLGNNRFDNLMQQIRTNGNSYIAVSIAYRLGAFGFLSSAEIKKYGVINAAVHDQRFALQWVKKNIHHFGGNPERVTISGESAGGGSVMLLAMANGGSEGDALFQGLIASSPYLPTQWNFDDAWPTLSYQAFIDQAGCSDAEVPFECLQSADTVVLQNASSQVSASANYGQWAFIPVTDGELIRKRPSEQLVISKKVNGLRVLTSNNENEAPGFTPQNITSKEEFISFVLTNYPRLSEQNLARILELYAVPGNASKIYADSDGLNPPFSTTNSNWAIGWQQAANNLYAETTFVCPSYWLADAFGGARGKRSWKYQFSVPISSHGADVGPLFDDPNVQGTGMDEVFRTAFQQTWGNFIVKGDPTLNTVQVGSAKRGNITAASTGNWPQWGGRPERDYLLNLNMTGGMPVNTQNQVGGKAINLTSYVPSTGGSYPELEASFNLVSGWSWEGGRGRRCQLWVDLGQWAFE